MVAYKTIGNEELEYILPSSVLLESEVNGKTNSNLLWCIDFVIKYSNYTVLYEMLIDDISLDGNSPNRIAFQFFIGSVNNSYFNYYLKYIRINRWVGNYYNPELRFLTNNQIIDNFLGPDSHSIEFSLRKSIFDKIYINSKFIWEEKGNSNINDWPDGMLSSNDFNFGYNYELFPSRPITSHFKIALSLDHIVSNKFKVIYKLDYSSIMRESFSLDLYISI